MYQALTGSTDHYAPPSTANKIESKSPSTAMVEDVEDADDLSELSDSPTESDDEWEPPSTNPTASSTQTTIQTSSIFSERLRKAAKEKKQASACAPRRK